MLKIKATQRYIEALATALSDNGKIQFHEGDKWVTDVKSKSITYNGYDLRQLDSQDVKGFLLHETAHVKHTTNTPDTEIQKKHPSMQQVYNALEDIRIEGKMIDEYGDFAKEGLVNSTQIAMERMAEAVDNGTFATASKLNKALVGKMTYLKNYADTLGNGKNASKVLDAIRAEDSELFSKVTDNVTSSLLRKIYDCKNTQEIKDLADRELYEPLKEYFEEADKAQAQGKKPLNDCSPGTESEEKSKGHGYTPNHIEKSGKIPDDWELEALLSPYINTLARKLSDVLKESQATRYTGAYKRGKLLSTNAYKVILNEGRIFSRKTNPRKPRYNVTMILDESGSMQGSNHVNTYIASFLLDKVAQKLGFSVDYIGYSNGVLPHKTLSEYRKIYGSGNNEYVVMNHVEKKLDYTADNLVFMMTDGGVTDASPRPQVEALKRKGVNLVAIGVGLTGDDIEMLRQHYPDAISVADTTLLPNVIIQQLQRLIHR